MDELETVRVDRVAVTRLLEVTADRWISNPELVIDEVRRFAGKIIPDHPLIQAKTLRAEREARTKFAVVERDKLREIEFIKVGNLSLCPVCFQGPYGAGHVSDCWLGKLLKEDR